MSKNFITVGCSVTYTKLMESLKPFYPELTEYLKRVGGEQIRNMGTIGGNIANASPIGDMLPPLIALKSEIEISNAESKIRTVPMEDFFIKYKVKDLKKNEFILSVKIPKPTKDLVFSNYKVSKRRDEDISSVCASFYFIVNKGHIDEARLVFGGMAEVPKRAKYTEDFLFGKPWTLFGNFLRAFGKRSQISSLQGDFKTFGKEWQVDRLGMQLHIGKHRKQIGKIENLGIYIPRSLRLLRHRLGSFPHFAAAIMVPALDKFFQESSLEGVLHM